jgi:hypothetical protein
MALPPPISPAEVAAQLPTAREFVAKEWPQASTDMKIRLVRAAAGQLAYQARLDQAAAEWAKIKAAAYAKGGRNAAAAR